MKRIILLLALVVLAAGTAFAHGVMGTVTAMTDDSITVQTKAKDPVTVYTMPDTKYENSGAGASMKDLKVGDRVVIHAAKMNDKLMATEVRFGTAAQATTKPEERRCFRTTLARCDAYEARASCVAPRPELPFAIGAAPARR